jgi:hypothetical protein
MLFRQQGQNKSYQFVKLFHLMLVVSMVLYLVGGVIPSNAAFAAAPSMEALNRTPIEASVSAFHWSPHQVLPSDSLQMSVGGQAQAIEDSAASAKASPIRSEPKAPSDGVSISISPASLQEGDAGSQTMVFTVTLSETSTDPITIDYQTLDGTAKAPGDYTSANSTLTIPADTISGTISITVLGDTLYEANETFLVEISNPSLGTITQGEAVGTILNDDPMPSLSIADVQVAEGNSGMTNATFTVTLSTASGLTTTVQYSTTGVTAQSGVDFIGASGTITFTPGVTNTLINVLVIGDTLDEFDETFTVVLSNAQNATLSGIKEATGTILDDDLPPSLSIVDAQVTEGNSGTIGMVFTVTLSTDSGKPITVTYETSPGTATSGVDYQPASGELVFTPGQTQKLVTVWVYGDYIYEYNETFSVILSASQNALISNDTAIGIILDDDAKPYLSINNVIINEGNSGTTNFIFSVNLLPQAGRPVTVTYATSDGSATAGVDYISASGMLTFPSGSTMEYITVTVKGDVLDEFDETFNVTLSNAPNATIINAIGKDTIQNDDSPPDLSVPLLIKVTEGDGSPVEAVFTVTLSVASGKPITVTYATQDGSAKAGENYTETHGELVFNPGELQKLITVEVTGDTICNVSRNFYVNLSHPINVNLPVSQMQALILNDDTCNVYLPSTIRTLTFIDHFDYTDTSLVTNYWEVVPEPSATWFVSNGEYHGKHTVANRNSKTVVKVYPPSMPASYSVEAKVKLASGSDTEGRGGLLFDFKANNQTYWFLIIPGATSVENNWKVLKYNPNIIPAGWDTIASGRETLHINPGNAVNLLRVERVGTQIRVYANGFLLWSGNDGTYTNGRAGLSIGTPADLASGEFVEVIFDDFIIGSLP